MSHQPDLTSLSELDLDEPVGLLLIAVAHFLTDADDPYGKVAGLTDELVPGSHLASAIASIR